MCTHPAIDKRDCWLQFFQHLLEVSMTAAQREVIELKRELAESGADPFMVAAEALAAARRYRWLLERAQPATPCNVPASTG